MKEKLTKHTGAILAIVVMIVVLSILAIFGGAIMKLFGFEYTSVGSIILFFILGGVLGFPIEMLAKGLPNTLLSFDKISLTFARVMYLVFDTIATIVAMTIVDCFMESVSANTLSIFVIAIIMALMGFSDIKAKPIE